MPTFNACAQLKLEADSKPIAQWGMLMKSIGFMTLLSTAFLSFWYSHALAQTEAPKELLEWKDWVLAGNLNSACIKHSVNKSKSMRICDWYSQVKVDILSESEKAQSEAFSANIQYSLTKQNEGMVILFGSRKGGNWPASVSVNGSSVLLGELYGKPAIDLGPGKYEIELEFQWKKLPNQIAIPKNMSFLDVTYNGAEINRIQVNPASELDLISLQDKKVTDSESVDSLSVKIYRRLSENVPLRSETVLDLKVSGSVRNEIIPGVVLPGESVTLIESPVSTRLKENGVFAKLRPGSYKIVLKGTFFEEVKQLSPLVQAREEIWLYESDPTVRQVRIEGVESVDANHLNIPSHWKGLSAYLMYPKDTLTFQVSKKGVEFQNQADLSIRRNIWLSFSGDHFSVLDAISGKVSKDWRIDSQEELKIASAEESGRNLLVTRGPKGAQGIEVRKENVALSVESRVERNGGRIPAHGWDFTAKAVNANLHVPPGWRLWFGSGVDRIKGSVFDKWSLHLLFLLFFIPVLLYRIVGLKGSFLAFVTLLLTLTERGAPQLSWGAAVIVVGVCTYMSEKLASRWKLLMQIPVYLVLGALIFTFAKHHIKVNLYPVLERGTSLVGGEIASRSQAFSGIAQEMLSDENYTEDEESDLMLQQEAPMAKMVPQVEKSQKKKSAQLPQNYLGSGQKGYFPQNYRKVNPNQNAQTGFGIPTWSWNTYSLTHMEGTSGSR